MIFRLVAGAGIDIPATPYALMLWLRGEDRGELVQRSRAMTAALAAAFTLDDVVEAFRYRQGDDLTGYAGGTANLQGEAAVAAAITQGVGEAFDGGSFLAIQQWVHELAAFEAHSKQARNDMIGRDIDSNEKIATASAASHVKRTTQEDFKPPAFIIRRAMPWSAADGEGLMFTAFGKSLDAFEALLMRMLGKDDGVVDALFTFTRPISGGYYWLPPMKGGVLHL